MRLKVLFEDQYTISAVMDDGACVVENALLSVDPQYGSYCDGLLDLLERAAEGGLQQFSSKQTHYINEDPKIYEFVRGPLRLVYFHGVGNTVVVCTELALKKTQKADKALVQRAIKLRNAYFESIESKTLIEVRDHD